MDKREKEMRIRHIVLNILPLPLWIAYYLLTISKNSVSYMPLDEIILLLIKIGFTIYNLRSYNIIRFLIRNLIMNTSLTTGCYITGQLYIKLCPHMSDEHYAVKSIPLDIGKNAVTITLWGCLIAYLMIRYKKKAGEN